jgi:cell division septal protein FtsQ
MDTIKYFDSIHEQLHHVNNKLKDINATIDMLMDEMVEMGWMEREEKDETGEINESSNQSTTYDVNVKYNTK